MTVDVAMARPIATQSLDEQIKYAQFLAKSEMLPRQFQRKPESVLWAIQYGRALGLNDVVVMSSVHVIENKPAPSAAMAAGLVRSKGHRLRVYVTPRSEDHRWGTAVAELTRADDPDFTFRSEWSVEDAIRAEICRLNDKGELEQYTKANGWKIGNWQHYPRQMMKARALGEVCRDGATDVLLGLVYLAEEIEDVELDHNGQLAMAPDAQVPTVRASDLVVEADARPLGEHGHGGDVSTTPAEQSPAHDAPPDESSDVYTPNPAVAQPITATHAKELSARIRALGVKEPGRALRLIGLALESEPPQRTADLTEAQFRAVMEQLSGEDEITVAAWLDQESLNDASGV